MNLLKKHWLLILFGIVVFAVSTYLFIQHQHISETSSTHKTTQPSGTKMSVPIDERHISQFVEKWNANRDVYTVLTEQRKSLQEESIALTEKQYKAIDAYNRKLHALAERYNDFHIEANRLSKQASAILKTVIAEQGITNDSGRIAELDRIYLKVSKLLGKPIPSWNP